MADFNIQMKRKNGAGFDNIYPMVKTENIIGNSSALTDSDFTTIYNFNNDITDSGTAGLNGVSSVDITYSSHEGDNYVSTNGTTSYITLPVMSNLVQGNGKFAVFLNFYNDGTLGNEPIIGDWQSGSGLGDSWLLVKGFSTDNQLTVYFRNSADDTNYSDTIDYTIPVGWNTIHFFYDNGFFRVNFNEGQHIYTRDLSGLDLLNVSGYNIWVGRYDDNYGKFDYKAIALNDESDFSLDQLQYLYKNSNFGIQDAPNDNTEYVRKNKNWVPSTAGGITEAPTDGTPYARQDSGWVSVPDNGAKILSDNITTIDYPDGGFKDLGDVTGAVKVTLPMAFSSTRMMIKLKLMREDGQTVDMVVAGYSYQSTPEWRFVDAFINSRNILDYTVRFGHDGGNPCFWIGETTTTWGILRVVIESVTLCVNNQAISNWKSGWTIEIDTAFGTVQEVINDAQNRLTDSPSDGNEYVRKDGAWAIASGGGLSDAPSDGNTYGRLNGSWAIVPTYVVEDGGLTEVNFTSSMNTKLSNIEDNANNYSHPANHPPSIISQDASNRFVTDAEKTTWNGKIDGTGTTEIVVLTQSAYDALGATPDTDGKVYIITG